MPTIKTRLELEHETGKNISQEKYDKVKAATTNMVLRLWPIMGHIDILNNRTTSPRPNKTTELEGKRLQTLL